jgi:predicted small lipoprotein YifL
MTTQRAAGFKRAAGLAMLPAMQLRQAVPTLLGLLFIALALAGCGRKGPLDLPPSAAAAPADTAQKKDDDNKISPIARAPKTQPRVVPKKDLPIDILLN